MSYCRWSSDDFACDLYVYGSAEGWVVHVASNRTVDPAPKVVWPRHDDDRPESRDLLVETHRAQMNFLATAERERINLPHAGETFYLSTADQCADTVERLLALGYRAPGYVVAELRDEARQDEPEGP